MCLEKSESVPIKFTSEDESEKNLQRWIRGSGEEGPQKVSSPNLLKTKAERSDQVAQPNLPSSLTHSSFRARLAELPPVTDLNLRSQILPFLTYTSFVFSESRCSESCSMLERGVEKTSAVESKGKKIFVYGRWIAS